MGEIEDEWIMKTKAKHSRGGTRNGSMNQLQEERQDNGEFEVRQEKLPEKFIPAC